MVVDGLVSCPSWRKKSIFLSCNDSYFIKVDPVLPICSRLTHVKIISKFFSLKHFLSQLPFPP